MYVIATSPRFSLGRSTPATLAIVALRSFERRLCPRPCPRGGLGGGRRGPADERPPPGFYPCLALCRGFLQITRVTPRRLMILQCSHRALIDGLTFIVPSPSPSPVRAPAPPAQPLLGGGIGRGAKPPSELFEPVRDPAPREVVRRQLDLHPIAREDPDEVHPHLAAHVREHPVTVVQLHSEHRVRQRLHHGPFDLDRVFLRHFRVSTSGSPSVTATVCSKWAARLPSLVTAVHPSSRILTSQLPIVTIGSIASTIPGLGCGPRPGSPKFGTWGSSCSARPMPCPTNARTTDRPCVSTCDWTAWDTSESRRPGQHSLMASSRLSRVTSSSF